MSPDAYAPEVPGGNGFQLTADGARWVASGGITIANAGDVLRASTALPMPSAGLIDCSALHPVDSSGVAVLLALKRRALNEGRPLAFTNITPSLHTLTDLYGVEDLLTT